MAFKPAERKNSKLRLAISGPSGTGKTMCALILASVFGKKIDVIDSERGSASLYVGAPGVPEFEVNDEIELTPLGYIAAIKESAERGAEVLVIDSYSHSWTGALEAIDRMGGWTKGGKTISPQVQKLVDTILTFPGHVIVTMRSKVEHAIETVNGRTTMKKMGMSTVAREGTDYEFSVMLDLTVDGAVSVAKSRCTAVATGTAYERNADIPKIGKVLKAWLEQGSPVTPRDALLEQIKFAANGEALRALVPALNALKLSDVEGFRTLRPLYAARAADFQQAAEAGQ